MSFDKSLSGRNHIENNEKEKTNYFDLLKAKFLYIQN